MEPELKGVVIITLPPVDDPSQGKTITAFSLSHQPHFLLPQPPRPGPRTIHSPTEEAQTSSSSSSAIAQPLRMRTRLFGFLGISLFAVCLWAFFFSSESLSETRQSSDDRDQDDSLIFPLYSKSFISGGIQRNASFKLGSSIRRDLLSFQGRLNGLKNGEMGSSFSLNSSITLPVDGNVYPDGLYYTSLLVGNPPSPYYLDVDTGSDLTWVQCDAPCKSCAKGPHPFYRPRKGKLVSKKDSLCLEMQNFLDTEHCESCQQCDYEVKYADQSSSLGVLVRDELHFVISSGSSTKSDFVFGCAYDQQGQLLNSPTKTDGILGLSNSPISLPSQLVNQRLISNVVGLCVSKENSEGGYMFFGLGLVPQWGMTWVPMLNFHLNLYEAEVKRISLGGQRLGASNQVKDFSQVIFDSGSTYTYLSREVYASLVSSLKGLAGKGFIQDEADPTLPVCWRADYPISSVEDVQKFFKPLTFHFKGKWWMRSPTLVIPPEGYLIASDKGNVCLGVLDGSGLLDGSTSILGDISLRGQLVVYDNVKKKIGWAQSDCINPRSLEHIHNFEDLD